MNGRNALNSLQIRNNSLKSKLFHEQLKLGQYSFEFQRKYMGLILNEYKKDLEFFYISNLFHSLLINDNETYFNSVKKELEDYDLWTNIRFSKELLRKIILLYTCNSYDDFKGEYLEIEFQVMNRKVKRLYRENRKLKRKFEHFKKINNDVHNSNSIKIINLLK